jgi:nucleoside-diphosphate-sugar epimerase
MENFPDSENKYVQSKVVLNKYVADIVKDREMVIHIQLHTLYGIGLPSSFMFLGQILSSLKSNSIFEMTSGHQLREYHHVEDAAFAIREITGSSINGVMHLSHGQPIELGELAEYIFLHFGKLSLLKKGALPDPYADNFNLSYQVNPVIKNVNFRDSVSSIVAYLNDCI